MNKRFASSTMVALSIASVLAGCASPHVVETSKTTDASLSCQQIEMEMREADRFKSDAQKEKGVTGTNVAAVLLFWPAMIGTYSNANEAIAAANTRKDNLMRLYEKKGCDAAGVASGGKPATPEVRLQSLKKMLDDGLISQAEYNERRAKILSEM